MAVIDIPLELIDDNPYNPRTHYPQAKIREMAQSLREVGLRQVPEGRHVDGRAQLAYGHMRLRGFLYNQKHDPYPANEKWKRMPIDTKEISDQDMFNYAWEENVRRTDITPIELARCIQAFSEMFPEVLDEDIGQKHSMSAQNVSNMKRVLRLPQKFLDKIDEGVISFSQGRELLTLEGLDNAENLMNEAINGLKIGNRQWGEANTLDGLQKSIYSIIRNHFPPLEKEFAGYSYDLLFDTRAAGCLECRKMVRTHPTKSQAAHFCSDEQCWQAKQTEHREQAAAAAKAKMQAEVINRAAQVIAQEEKAPPPVPVMIDENTILVDQETFEKVEASYSADRISEGTAVRKPVESEGKLYLATGSGMGKVEAYQLVPRAEYTGEVRTYRVPAGREYEKYYESLRNDPSGFYHSMLVKRGKEDYVLVGPKVTFVTKVDEGDFSHEKLPGQMAAADETDRWMEKMASNLEHPVAELTPTEIPEDVLQKAKEAAGTRAEILDLNDICTGERHWRQVKSGYVILSDELRLLDDPEECLERCTHGFHYAFDSKAREQKEIYICSDSKCLAQKKGALTRKRNATGLARKNAERKAIQEAIAGADNRPRGIMMLVLYTQLRGDHISKYGYYHGAKAPDKWLWDKVSAGTKEEERNIELLMKKLDKLDETELRKILVEMMFHYLVDHGDTGSYEIKTALPLRWLGVEIELPEETIVMENER